MKFTDFSDIEKLRELCDSFTSFTGAVAAVLDLEGNILVSTGWQDICTNFHRANHLTSQRCRESDTNLNEQLKKEARCRAYRCKNGLMDVAVPIIIGNEHKANFFTGQFFFEKPDREYFIRQAEEFGFDKHAYLEALDSVPVYSEIYIMKMMEFLAHLARVIGESEYARKNVETIREQLQIELNDSVKRIRTLSGLLPICAVCKKIRNDKGSWEQIEEYVRSRSHADFSHGICPDCAQKLYPDIFIQKLITDDNK